MRVNRRAERSSGYGLAADVWSFGINLYYFWVGQLPFAEHEGLPFDIYNIVLYDHDGLPEYEDFGHDRLAEIIRGLLQRSPADRPTFKDLTRDPFFLQSGA